MFCYAGYRSYWCGGKPEVVIAPKEVSDRKGSRDIILIVRLQAELIPGILSHTEAS